MELVTFFVCATVMVTSTVRAVQTNPVLPNKVGVGRGASALCATAANPNIVWLDSTTAFCCPANTGGYTDQYGVTHCCRCNVPWCFPKCPDGFFSGDNNINYCCSGGDKLCNSPSCPGGKLCEDRSITNLRSCPGPIKYVCVSCQDGYYVDETDPACNRCIPNGGTMGGFAKDAVSAVSTIGELVG